MKLLLNYDYSQYPYTTASYFEMEAQKIEGIEVLHFDVKSHVKPDLILNIMPFPDLIGMPGVPAAYYEIDCHLIRGKNNELYDAMDRVYIAQKPFLELYPKGKTFYLPLGADMESHCLNEKIKPVYDIGFIGNDTYPKRRTLLEQLETKYKVLRTNSKPGRPFADLLSSCRLTFNCAMDRDINMRFFEAMACGRMLLSDYLPDQDELATNGVHYVAYKDWADLDKKVEYYLSHYKERETIAREGALNIARHHTYRHRLLKILDDFGYKF